MYVPFIVTDRVAWSVSLCITVVSRAKNSWTDRDVFWVVPLGGHKEPCIWRGSKFPCGRGNFGGRGGTRV